MPKSRRKFHRIGVLFKDDEGNLIFEASRSDHTKQGGRPKKILRDVSLTLHFEYLCEVEGAKVGLVQMQVAKLFGLKDQDKVRSIVKKTRADILRKYPHLIITRGGEPDAQELIPGRMMMTYLMRDEGTAEGFAVYWGRQEACYGRITCLNRDSFVQTVLDGV